MTLQIKINLYDEPWNEFTCTHTAIQVQFLLNTTTTREGSVVKLDIQFQLKPPNVTLLEPVIVTVAVVDGSATGRLEVLLHVVLFNTAALIQSQLLNYFHFTPYRG